MDNNKTKSIIQAIELAEKNLVLAKNLLGDSGMINSGIVGEFDGESVVTKEGRRYQVPPNYASKSQLVVGDTLRIIGSGERTVFKQIKKIERIKTSGILTKKDGQWTVVIEQGSFLVLPASVNYLKGKFGDEVEVIIPKDYKRIKSKWAVLERVIQGSPESSKVVSTVSVKPAIVESAKKTEAQKKPTTTETRKGIETQKKVETVIPEQSKQPKLPKKRAAQKEKSATPFHQGYGERVAKSTETRPTTASPSGEGGRESAEVQKKPVTAETRKGIEVQKRTILEQPKPLKQSTVKGEIKVEEELR